MGHDVFISYSSNDKLAADAVCAALESNGMRCWIAPRDIKPGENWATSILHGIAECRMMVLVFSSHTNASNHIRREVERAVHRGIPIAPIRVEDALPKDDLEYFLSSSHWMDALTPPLERHLREFTSNVRALLEVGGQTAGKAPELAADGPRPDPAPPALSPPVSAKSKSRLPALLVAVMILTGLAAVGWMRRADLRRMFAGPPESTPTTQGVSISSTANPSAAPATKPALAADSVAATLPVPPPETPAARTAREQGEQLKSLRDLLDADKIAPDQYKLGQMLLKSASSDLDEYNTARREQFLAAVQGRLAPDKLADALNAIETPDQKAAHAAREEMERKDALRAERIGQLLATARADQSIDKGVEGLAALEALLKLDPANAEAVALRSRLQSMMAQAQTERDEQQRRQRGAALLQQAQSVSDKPEQALALLAELLKSDPANTDALSLKAKLEASKPVASRPAAPGKEFANTLGMKFIRIDPGEFLMGSPAVETGRAEDETQHKVKITKAFLLGVHHVTRGQFAAFVKDSAYRTEAEKTGWAYAWDGATFGPVPGASWKAPGFDQTDDHPVTQVSWNDAMAFCTWVSGKEGREYRLPTEAQWEYACRAGTTAVYFWGDAPDGGAGFANCADLTAREKYPAWPAFNWHDGFVYTSPVGSFKPNPWGLYDTIGNLWEWCSDFYAPYTSGDATDPTGPASGDTQSSRVLRGGSWFDDARACRCAYRFRFTPDLRARNFGFRVCLDP